MAPKTSSLLFLALFFVFSSTSTAFNITRLLGQYPDYGTFNDLLSQTKLAAEINTRQTITILAVSNESIGHISGLPLDEVKRILSNHVILDYYDIMKLKKLNKKSNLLTTLYQTTGVAQNQQGFLNVTATSSGDILFGSAVKPAVLNSKLVGSVASQPFNISVLEVSEPIVAPGFENGPIAPPPPPKADTPVAAPKKAPAKAPTPSQEDDTPEDAPTEAPTDSSPMASPPSPTADAPADSPDADSPDADSPDSNKAADAAPAPKSGSSRMTVGSGVGVAVVIGLVLSFVGF